MIIFLVVSEDPWRLIHLSHQEKCFTRIYLREDILELSSFNVVKLLIDAAIIDKLSDEFWADTAIVKVVKCSKEDRLLNEHWKIN